MARIVIIIGNPAPGSKWIRGDIVDVLADGATGGNKVTPPYFGIVDIPGITMSQVDSYKNSWQFKLDYSAVWHDAQKGYRITAWSKDGSVSGIGKLTVAKIQNYLDRYNCIFQSEDNGQIVFDLGVYQVGISEGFWKRAVDGIIFKQVQYVDNVSRISADYSATGIGQTAIEKYVEKYSDGVISHDGQNKIIVFDISRETAVARFKGDVADTLHGSINDARRRFNFNSAFTDQVAAAPSGILETDKATAIANIVDKAEI